MLFWHCFADSGSREAVEQYEEAEQQIIIYCFPECRNWRASNEIDAFHAVEMWHSLYRAFLMLTLHIYPLESPCIADVWKGRQSIEANKLSLYFCSLLGHSKALGLS